MGWLCWYKFFCASTYQEDTFSMKNHRHQIWAMKHHSQSPVNDDVVSTTLKYTERRVLRIRFFFVLGKINNSGWYDHACLPSVYVQDRAPRQF